MSGEPLVRVIARQSGLRRAAEVTQHPVHELLERSPALHRFLHGTWLGHPLHPALTDLPVGAWTASALFDLLERVNGGRALQ